MQALNSAKFLIASNPIVNDGRVFIIHTQDPVIIAEVIDNNIEGKYIGETNLESTKIAGIMRRMGDWYINYLNWKKEQ